MSAKDKELEMCRESTQEVHHLCKRLEMKTSSMQQEFDFLKTAVKSLPHSEDFSDIVFDAQSKPSGLRKEKKKLKILKTAFHWTNAKN